MNKGKGLFSSVSLIPILVFVSLGKKNTAKGEDWNSQKEKRRQKKEWESKTRKIAAGHSYSKDSQIHSRGERKKEKDCSDFQIERREREREPPRQLHHRKEFLFSVSPLQKRRFSLSPLRHHDFLSLQISESRNLQH